MCCGNHLFQQIRLEIDNAGCSDRNRGGNTSCTHHGCAHFRYESLDLYRSDYDTARNDRDLVGLVLGVRSEESSGRTDSSSVSTSHAGLSGTMLRHGGHSAGRDEAVKLQRYYPRALLGFGLVISMLGNPWWSVGQEMPSTLPIRDTPKESIVEFTGGISGWLATQGRTQWNHDFSRLTYKDDMTHIVELSGQATFSKRWFVRGNFGYGMMGGGTLVDEDFSSSNGPLELSTTSKITGNNLWYLNGDVGMKAIRFPNSRGTIGFFTGVQYWRQQHEATGVVQTLCNPVLLLCDPANTGQEFAPGRIAITNTSTWLSWRLGVDADYRVTRKFSIEGKFVFMPISSLTNDDIHHLRTTDIPIAPGFVLPALQQDPSFRMRGVGIGTNVEASATYMIVPRLFASVGYRFWWNRVMDGTLTQYTKTFGSSSVDLNEFATYRHGVTVGLRYVF